MALSRFSVRSQGWKSAYATKALTSGPTGRDSSAQPNGLGNVRIITGGLKGSDTLGICL